jgi:hypothetical protein
MLNDFSQKESKYCHRMAAVFFILHLFVLGMLVWHYTIDTIILCTITFILGAGAAAFKVLAKFIDGVLHDDN